MEERAAGSEKLRRSVVCLCVGEHMGEGGCWSGGWRKSGSPEKWRSGRGANGGFV